MRRRSYIAGVTASLALALVGSPNAGMDATPFCTICGDPEAPTPAARSGRTRPRRTGARAR